LATAPIVIVTGPTIVCVSVQDALAPDASQKPAVFAVAIDMLAATAPAVSRPVTAPYRAKR
jgi:hypothetical protein